MSGLQKFLKNLWPPARRQRNHPSQIGSKALFSSSKRPAPAPCEAPVPGADRDLNTKPDDSWGRIHGAAIHGGAFPGVQSARRSGAAPASTGSVQRIGICPEHRDVPSRTSGLARSIPCRFRACVAGNHPQIRLTSRTEPATAQAAGRSLRGRSCRGRPDGNPSLQGHFPGRPQLVHNSRCITLHPRASPGRKDPATPGCPAGWPAPAPAGPAVAMCKHR